MTTLDEILSGSPLGNLFNQDNPDSGMALLQAGMQMLQPQVEGTSFAQNLGGGAISGLNYLSNLEQQRNKAGLDQQRENSAETLANARADESLASIGQRDRQLDQGDIGLAIDQFSNETERSKLGLLVQAAQQEANEETDDLKKAMLEGVLDIYNTKAGQAGEFDAEELMSVLNLINSGYQPDKPIYDAENDIFVISGKALQPELDDEGNEIPGSGLRTVSALTIDALYGRGMSERLKSFYTKQREDDLARGVNEVSGVEPDIDPDTGEIRIGTNPDKSATPGSTQPEGAVANEEDSPLLNLDLNREEDPGRREGESLMDFRVRQGQTRNQKRERSVAFLKARRKSLGLVGGTGIQENLDKVLADYKANFSSLSEEDKEFWIEQFGSFVSEDIRKAARRQLRKSE